MATTSFLTESPCAMSDEILLKLTRECLLSYITDMNYLISEEEFKTKKDIIQEFRRLQVENEKKSFSSSSSSIITWPGEYHVLQVPI